MFRNVMKRTALMGVSLSCCLVGAGLAHGQVVTVYRPAIPPVVPVVTPPVVPVLPAPVAALPVAVERVVVERPVLGETAWQPYVSERPATVVVEKPATMLYSPPVSDAPVVSYSVPVAAPVAAPAIVPSPVVPSVSVVMPPAVVISPKVYVPGQPVRNFFKAITP